MITKKYLKWRKNGTTYQAHLHTAKFASQSKHICVRKDNVTYYVPLYQGTNSNRLCVNVGGTSYYAPDATPVLDITYTCRYDADPYSSHYYYKNVTLSINSAINNAINLQSNTSGSWVTRVTLPAGSTSASMTSEQGWATTSLRIKIGSWTSSFTATTGTNTKRISIPEAQWGV